MEVQKVITRISAKSYYSDEIIPEGIVGLIVGDKVACVRLRTDCKCQTFVCVEFPGRKRAAYHEHELVRVAKEVI
jgi:hypothetical protein